jgi:hypothetical protein
MSVSLGGLVNMSRLEDIINGLLAKMQLQSEQIHKLTTEVKTRATMADYKVVLIMMQLYTLDNKN